MMGDWTFFSNHGHVLVCLARDRDARLRDVAMQVGITERAVQKIVRDLQDEGFLAVSKHGRRNRYQINNRKSLRHPLQSGCTVGQLLGLLSKADDGGREQGAKKPAPREEEAAKPKPPKPETPPVESPKSPDTGDRPPDRDLEQGRLF